MKQNIVNPAVLVCMIFQFASCGKDAGGPGAPVVMEHQEPQVEHPEVEAPMSGQFLAVIGPVNEIVSGRVTGAVTIARDNDEFVGDVRFSGGPLTASTLHAQSVRTGTRCPIPDDDKNHDGFIDAIEGELVYGKVLIPLDGDLNAQHLDLGTYPYADQFGSYIYSEVASYEKLFSDLKEKDINPEDYLIKLEETVDLKVTGKVVVIEGISLDANLPESVQSISQNDRHHTLPVACGVVRKVNSSPGTIERDLPRDRFERKPGGTAGEDDLTIIIPPEIAG